MLDAKTAARVHELAKVIRQDWKKVNFAAVPYLDAMGSMELLSTGNYYMDSGKSVVLYFLSNATTWKGEVAKATKAELKRLVGIK